MIFGGLPNLIIYGSLLFFVREKFLNNGFSADLRVPSAPRELALDTWFLGAGEAVYRLPPGQARSRLFQVYGQAPLILIHILSVCRAPTRARNQLC